MSFELSLLRKLRGFVPKPVETYEDLYNMFFVQEKTEAEIEEDIRNEILTYFKDKLKINEEISEAQAVQNFRSQLIGSIFEASSRKSAELSRESSERGTNKRRNKRSKKSKGKIKEITGKEEEGAKEEGTNQETSSLYETEQKSIV